MGWVSPRWRARLLLNRAKKHERSVNRCRVCIVSNTRKVWATRWLRFCFCLFCWVYQTTTKIERIEDETTVITVMDNDCTRSHTHLTNFTFFLFAWIKNRCSALSPSLLPSSVPPRLPLWPALSPVHLPFRCLTRYCCCWCVHPYPYLSSLICTFCSHFMLLVN